MKTCRTFAAPILVAAVVTLLVAVGARAQSTGTTGSSAGGAREGMLLDSKSLVGSTVRDAQGKELGKVDHLLIDPKDGRVQTVVISMGGTLGVGGNLVAMPWSQVKVGQDRGKLVVTVDSQALQQAPRAERDRDRAPSASPPASGTSPSGPPSGSGTQQK